MNNAKDSLVAVLDILCMVKKKIVRYMYRRK